MSKSKLLIGFHAITARLRHGAKSIDEIYFEADHRDHRMQDFLKAAKATGVRLIPANADRLRGIVDTNRHQGVVAKTESLLLVLNLDELLDDIEDTPLLLVLDGVTDPHNLGACLRVADATGAYVVIAPRDHSVRIDTTVAKVANGVTETVLYITVANLVHTLCELQECDVQVIGAADEAKQNLYQADFKGPTAAVVGAEGEDMRRLTRETCDTLVSIPMTGSVESLNMPVTSGVCLFEAVRQRATAPAKR